MKKIETNNRITFYYKVNGENQFIYKGKYCKYLDFLVFPKEDQVTTIKANNRIANFTLIDNDIYGEIL